VTQRRLVFSALAVVVCALVWPVVWPSVSSAVSNDQWEMAPSQPTSTSPARAYLEYEVQPGQLLHDSVTIRNLTIRTLTLQLYPADAVNTPRSAAFGLRPPDAPRVDVATWVHLATSPVVLMGNSQVDVPFDVLVPANASPGDHAGGVVAVNTTPSSRIGGGRGQIGIVQGIGVRIYARVSGPLRPGLAVQSQVLQPSFPVISHLVGRGRVTINYSVANVGNTREAAVARIRFTDFFGRTVAKLPDRRLPELLPGGRVDVAEVWNHLPAGRFTARLEVFSADARVARQRRFWAFGLTDLVLVILPIAAVALVLWTRKRRRAGVASEGASREKTPVAVS
jgi:hypothetical protein